MKSSGSLITAGSESWQQGAARFLLCAGFKPGEEIGQVEHISGSSRVGRTFGSVWREMRSLVERETEGASGNVQGSKQPLVNLSRSRSKGMSTPI